MWAKWILSVKIPFSEDFDIFLDYSFSCRTLFRLIFANKVVCLNKLLLLL